MTTLAPKLPYNHAFAGNYPRVAGQPTPTDPDCLDYLARLSAADGAGVEVGVAMAVDAFVKGCKADGIWDAIKASCILCGARTIAGALVPLAGTAPTGYNFVSANYNRETGLIGVPASSTRIDTNRPNNADGQNDNHISVYATAAATIGNSTYLGEINTYRLLYESSGFLYAKSNGAAYTSINGGNVAGFLGSTRSDSTNQTARANGTTLTTSVASVAPSDDTMKVFSRASSLYSDARLAFYSIGSSLDLALLDSRVTTLVSEIAAAIP